MKYEDSFTLINNTLLRKAPFDELQYLRSELQFKANREDLDRVKIDSQMAIKEFQNRIISCEEDLGSLSESLQS